MNGTTNRRLERYRDSWDPARDDGSGHVPDESQDPASAMPKGCSRLSAEQLVEAITRRLGGDLDAEVRAREVVRIVALICSRGDRHLYPQAATNAFIARWVAEGELLRLRYASLSALEGKNCHGRRHRDRRAARLLRYVAELDARKSKGPAARWIRKVVALARKLEVVDGGWAAGYHVTSAIRAVVKTSAQGKVVAFDVKKGWLDPAGVPAQVPPSVEPADETDTPAGVPPSPIRPLGYPPLEVDTPAGVPKVVTTSKGVGLQNPSGSEAAPRPPLAPLAGGQQARPSASPSSPQLTSARPSPRAPSWRVIVLTPEQFAEAEDEGYIGADSYNPESGMAWVTASAAEVILEDVGGTKYGAT